MLLTRRASLALAAGGTLAAAAAARQAHAAPEGLGRLIESEPRPLPALDFTDANGAPHHLPEFTGRAVLLNLWATWCPPCVAEMPALDRLQGLLAAEGVTVLALASDRGGRAQVEPFYASHDVKRLGLWLDPRGAAARTLGVRGLPTTVIVDREGQERARLEGSAAWDAPAMLAAVRRLTGAPPAPVTSAT